MKFELFSDGGGDIKGAAWNKGSAVIDSHDHAAAIFQIGNASTTGQGQGLVSGTVCPWPDVFTGGYFAWEDEPSFRVMRSDTVFDKANSFSRRNWVIGDAFDHIRALRPRSLAFGFLFARRSALFLLREFRRFGSAPETDAQQRDQH